MARLVERFRNTPYAVTVRGETSSICGCGLSATQPFCDGTHTISQSEAVGKTYWYDDAGERHLAADGEGYYIRSDKQPQGPRQDLTRAAALTDRSPTPICLIALPSACA